jgi:hypothetical protein
MIFRRNSTKITGFSVENQLFLSKFDETYDGVANIKKSHPQCRDVSWNVLKKAGSWYMPHGFMIRGWIRHAECLTCRFLRTFHGARPYTVDGSLVVVFTNPKLELI